MYSLSYARESFFDPLGIQPMCHAIWGETQEAKSSVAFIPTARGTRVDFRRELRFKGFMRLIKPLMRSSLMEQRKETLEAVNDYVKEHQVP